jgi:hypothetical protein
LTLTNYGSSLSGNYQFTVHNSLLIIHRANK